MVVLLQHNSMEQETCFNISSINSTTIASLSYGNRITFTVFNSILALLMCGGNALFIIMFLVVKKLQTTATFFLFHLAFADLLVGIALIYYIPFIWIPEMTKSVPLCLVKQSLFLLSLTASILCLFSVSIERLITIKMPLKRRVVFSKWRLRLAALIIWILAFTIGVLAPVLLRKRCKTLLCEPTFDIRFEFKGIIFIPFCFVMGALLVSIQLTICYELQRNMKKSQMLSNNNPHQVKLKVARTVGVIVSVFLISWFPFFVNQGIVVYGGHLIKDPSEYYTPKYVWANVLGLLNSGINVFIYAISMPKFRTAIRYLCLGNKQTPSHRLAQPSQSSLNKEIKEKSIIHIPQSLLPKVLRNNNTKEDTIVWIPKARNSV